MRAAAAFQNPLPDLNGRFAQRGPCAGYVPKRRPMVYRETVRLIQIGAKRDMIISCTPVEKGG
jgi:hypothetical protein